MRTEPIMVRETTSTVIAVPQWGNLSEFWRLYFSVLVYLLSHTSCPCIHKNDAKKKCAHSQWLSSCLMSEKLMIYRTLCLHCPRQFGKLPNDQNDCSFSELQSYNSNILFLFYLKLLKLTLYLNSFITFIFGNMCYNA